MLNNKSLGNDGLTKEFYEAFWEEIKIPLCNSIKYSEIISKTSCNKT